jgi:hypothetical protein
LQSPVKFIRNVYCETFTTNRLLSSALHPCAIQVNKHMKSKSVDALLMFDGGGGALHHSQIVQLLCNLRLHDGFIFCALPQTRPAAAAVSGAAPAARHTT